MKTLIAVFPVLILATSTFAKDGKFVGVWEGEFETPIYTKLVVGQDQSLVYCEVSSCRDVRCMDMPYTGSLQSTFEYSDESGSYVFERISEEEFEGTYTHVLGDVSTAYYEPE